MTRWLLGQFLCNFCMHKQPFSPLPPWFFSIMKTWGSFYVFFPLPVITLLCFLSSSSHVYSSMFSFLFPCILLCLLVTIFLYLYLLFFFYHNFLVNFSPSLKTHLNPKSYLKKKNEASCTLLSYNGCLYSCCLCRFNWNRQLHEFTFKEHFQRRTFSVGRLCFSRKSCYMYSDAI